jgi:hypothetical protein
LFQSLFFTSIRSLSSLPAHIPSPGA